ncbi:Competence-damage inducible protein CinA [Legionella beliardensis]|uniref:Competence-damage inducible protein CinA n=1 Tax=Legionella beliardensis TaxID=91822 RepID=A0A378JPP2_9GAMM|nr:nicotinamide-nucleotide amidohydrolase family protein [Legionella beliardensis]STX55566.1 Competence-damage inducible protein CinA [Legionella beliardensis]
MKNVINYLKQNHLILSTAESCTAGQVLAILANFEGCGECIDVGYVVYSESAKKDILKVKQNTIERYTLTSEQVAREMACGAFYKSRANVVLATTGLTGEKPMDGIKPGTICFAWGFKGPKTNDIILFSETKIFEGERAKIQTLAAEHALLAIPSLHKTV